MKRGELNQVYDEYHEMVLHLAFDILQDYGLSQSVCLEVFTRLHEEMESLDRDCVKGWLLRYGKQAADDLERKSCKEDDVTVIAEQTEEDYAVE